MPTITRSDKQYRGNTLMDAIIAQGVDPTTFGVSTAPDGSTVTVTYNNASDETIINTELDNHDASVTPQWEARDTLKELALSDALPYFRQAFIDANGNGAQIAGLYDDARAYEQQNAGLTAYMLTQKKIYETAELGGISITLTTNEGKARYLQIFMTALSAWS